MSIFARLSRGLRTPSAVHVSMPVLGEFSFLLHESGDPWISGFIAQGRVFDPHILSVLSGLVEPGTTLVDVGANIGWFSVIGSRLVGPSGKVLAFEPDPDNMRLLRANIRRNRAHNVRVLPAALSDKRSIALLSQSSENRGDHRLSCPSHGERRICVKTTTADIELAQHAGQVGVIKLDTQGSEAKILRGMQETLSSNPNIRVVLEFWPYGLATCGQSAAELVELLATRPSSLWLLRTDFPPQPITPEDLLQLTKQQYAPETQAHADLAWIANSDAVGLERMRELESTNTRCTETV